MGTVLRWLFETLYRPTTQRRAPVPDATRPVRPPLPRRARFAQPIDGDAVPLVRPYLVAHERRVEAYRQRERRRALVLATMGIDYPVVVR